jgi:RNA polymerase primary sigma factor
MQALAEQSRIVRLPLNRVSAVAKINQTFSRLEQKFQREPTAEELAEVLSLLPEEVDNNLRISGRHVSMDAPLVQGEDSSLGDLLTDHTATKPDERLMDDSLRRDIELALDTLSRREAEVMALYFGLSGNAPASLDEIAEKFDLTRERVRQIKEKATQRLRAHSRGRRLKSYLG